MVLQSIRKRKAATACTTAGIGSDASIAEFQAAIAAKSGVPAANQELMTGFPPQPLHVPADPTGTVTSLGISSGETILVRRTEKATVPAPPVNVPSIARPAQDTQQEGIDFQAWPPRGSKV